MSNKQPPEAFTPTEQFHSITASPDGSQVAYFIEEQDTVSLYVEDIEGDRLHVRTDDGWFPGDTIIWGGQEQVFVTQRDLGNPASDIYRVFLDGTLQPVITREERCLPLDASPDGHYLLFGTQQGREWKLCLFDTLREETEILADVSGHHYHHQAGFSLDGRYLAYHAPVPGEETEHVRSYLRDLDRTDERRLVTDDVTRDLECLSWNEQSDQILLIENDGNTSRYCVFDLQSKGIDWFDTDASLKMGVPGSELFIGTTGGEMTQSVVVVDASGLLRHTVLDDGMSGVVGNPPLANGDVLLTHETPTQPSSAVRYDVATETTEPLLEESIEVDHANLVDPEWVAYESNDGTEIHGLLFDSGQRPSPALVDVLGGPTTPVRREFSPRIQYLASQGYTVLQPNYRGSAGRGEEFKNAIKEDYGGVEIADIAAGGRWLAARDWIDADRVAAYGHSWGAYNVYMQLVKNSDIWAACAALNGPTDLQAMYEEYGQPAILEEELGGSPEDRPDYYHERSPINHVDQDACPILILTGEEDPTLDDVTRFRDELVAHGKEPGDDFEYRVLERQDHGPGTMQQRTEVMEAIVDFLSRHM